MRWGRPTAALSCSVRCSRLQPAAALHSRAGLSPKMQAWELATGGIRPCELHSS